MTIRFHAFAVTIGLALVSSALPAPAQPVNAVRIIGAADPAALKVPEVPGPEIWRDPSQPTAARVADLLRRMSLAEKASQLMADAPAIPRLGIPAYSYRNECAHGVADAGIATVFPQTIGMAATWDAPLLHEEGDAAATEGRAIYNNYTAHHHGNSIMHRGLSFYAPNINIVRDPRWGRGQETFGEDPFLTSRLAVAYIEGMQGDNPKYMKTIACAKHFAVHSGPEPLRKSFNALPPQEDLYDTYLPAFEACVREGHVGSVMGSYNALYGVPNCANPFLLTDILRQKWGFQGFVVSDGGAVQNIWMYHKYVASPEEAAAAAVKAGCDLFSGSIDRGEYPRRDFADLGKMLAEGLLTEQQIDGALKYTLAARFRLGLFDPPSMVPWSGITMADNDTAAHRALALKVAEESIVLLKNNGLLPLDRNAISHLAVIGPNADAVRMLYGNYNGVASHPVTILEGIEALAGTNIQVTYARGCPLAIRDDHSNLPTAAMTAQAVAAAKAADVVIFVGGLDSTLETEEHPSDFEGFLGGDRTRIELPPPQERLLRILYKTGKPIVYVNCSGSAMAMPWEARHLPAIIQAWYPGEEGGTAVAEVLFGDVNPAGRLPITFYSSTRDLPRFEDYSMDNRTYRYYQGKPLFAFGHGLSYTRFDYSDVKLASPDIKADGTVRVSFTVTNSAGFDGDEVAQVYFRHVHPYPGQPQIALCGFVRLHLAREQDARVTMDIPAKRFRDWDTSFNEYVVETGRYELLIGGASDDIRLKAKFEITGAPGVSE